MANPLYQSMNNQPSNNLFQQFNQFKQNFKGDARQQVQQMLNSGRISQQQYNQAVQMAHQFQRLLGGR